MYTYAFEVVVELDEGRWHAYCPAFESYGAATWRLTRDEAYKCTQELVAMIIVEFRKDGIDIPQNPTLVGVSDSRVAVTV